jgi:hypothetical protein
MSVHAREVSKMYLRKLLSPLIIWLLSQDTSSFEIDPAKLQKSQQSQNLERNKQNFF